MPKTQIKDDLESFDKNRLPLFLYPGATKAEKARMTRLKKEGRIFKIGPRLYTSASPSKKMDWTVRYHWHEIVSNLFPDAHISHRSALEMKPTPDGQLYITSNTNRTITYPGLVLNFVRGPSTRSDDVQSRGLSYSSYERALLENYSVTSATSDRALPDKEIENRIWLLLNYRGVEWLNELRARAKKISEELNWHREFQKLSERLDVALATEMQLKDEKKRRRVQARAKPFNVPQARRLDVVFSELKRHARRELTDSFIAKDHFKNKKFIEAYFSHRLSGAELDIEVAHNIVQEQNFDRVRTKDDQSFLSLYELLSDTTEMRRTPSSTEEMIDLLKRRHQILTWCDPETSSGKFRTDEKSELIAGTLEVGFGRYLMLDPGLDRAMFMLLLISVVQPFEHGNGRIARAMMNAELFSLELSTIIFPTVYRNDYETAIRSVLRRWGGEEYIAMVAKAHLFSTFEFSNLEKTVLELEERNWFRESYEARLIEA